LRVLSKTEAEAQSQKNSLFHITSQSQFDFVCARSPGCVLRSRRNSLPKCEVCAQQQILNKSNQVLLPASLYSFHSFFKVLFTFPSQYLSAIGDSLIFSLGNQLVPSLELQSRTTRLFKVNFVNLRPFEPTHETFTLWVAIFAFNNFVNPEASSKFASLDYNSMNFAFIDFKSWTASCSFAITEEVLFSFLSFT